MSSLISWFIIGMLVVGMGISALLSYQGVGTRTRAANYPRVEKSSGSSGGLFIRTGSTGGGSSTVGGGSSFGK